jgi:uncharacterized protein (TIGR02284 family)
MNDAMPTPLELDSRTVDMINRLIQHQLDGQAGYEAAASNVKSEQYQTMLREFAVQRGEFAAEWSQLLEHQGKAPVESGTLGGLLQQGWVNLKAVLTNGDGAILVECANADDATLSAYQSAIGETTDEGLLTILRRQFTDVRNAHDRVRALATALTSRGH